MPATLTSPSATEASRSTPTLLGALLGFVAVAQLAGIVGLPFTDTDPGSWYDRLERPFFNPPGWVFGTIAATN